MLSVTLARPGFHFRTRSARTAPLVVRRDHTRCRALTSRGAERSVLSRSVLELIARSPAGPRVTPVSRVHLGRVSTSSSARARRANAANLGGRAQNHAHVLRVK